MPTDDRRHAVSPDEAWNRAGDQAFPAKRPGDLPDRIGLEPEILPIYRDSGGDPAGRVPLRDPGSPGVLDVLDHMVCGDGEFGTRHGGPIGPWEYPMADGGRLTFEPGAQIEHSTGVFSNAAEVLADVQRVLECLRDAFAPHGVVLAAAGMDIWNDVSSVPQQLPFGRYTAQAAYYERRGPWGRIMMRHTASLQINLDLGPGDVGRERWLAANLISPLITATFACSPGEGGASTRTRAWQELDPTRSGFPSALVDRSLESPREQWARSAMDADVMLIRTNEGRWEPGEPGFTFEKWVRDGHPELGWPTMNDLEYHLTTLFFEVRPRGFLELRAGEQVPDCWRAAQVVLVTAAIYDEASRRAVVDRLDAHRERLPALWRTAASVGVADAELRELAMTTWEQALEGVDRIGRDDFGEAGVDCARRFLEEFTSLGRTPADLLRELHHEGPAHSLAWAASSQL